MQDLNKISYFKLYLMAKNLIINLLLIVISMTITRLFHPLVSPILTLVLAGVIYARMYDNRRHKIDACQVVDYATFLSLISFAFISIIINMLHVWGMITISREFVFLKPPFIPSLMMMPICFIVVICLLLRGNRVGVCIRCRLEHGDERERGKLGILLSHEHHLQLKNLAVLYGSISVVIWTYFQFSYIHMNQNDRDWFVFTWLVVIAFLLDIAYFIARYYNLYLDLKEYDEIISPEELYNMGPKTYLRYYVICGNSIWLKHGVPSLDDPDSKVIETPFISKKSREIVSDEEVRKTIADATGISDGHLRFYFGRRLEDIGNHSILRYFYFLDGKPEDYPNLTSNGEWMDFNRIKQIFTHEPQKMSRYGYIDLRRLAVIMITSKLYFPNGERRHKLRNFQPSFTLEDVRNSKLDFQSNTYMRVSLFNADSHFFRIRRFFKRLLRRHQNNNVSMLIV